MPPKAHNKERSQIFTDPFPHLTISNFLSPEVYKKTFQIYNKLQFKKKQTDLFQFFQTDELNAYKKLDYFKDELDKQFWQLWPMKTNSVRKQDAFYSIFASYYFKGNYLLCHDDVIEDRLYAFSYYLEDHDSGDLVLFNKDANQQVKRIKVKKNTLAIFQVSNYSYHQVDYTKTDGRKAITGWFNIKGLGEKRIQKTIPSYIPCLPPKNKTMEFQLNPEHYSEQYFQLMDIQYQFNIKKTKLQGPFYSRRVHKVELDKTVVFVLPGYNLYSVQIYSFKKGDYILLNDPVNTIQGDDIIDLFVTNLPPDFQRTSNEDDEQDQQGDMLVKIVQEGDEETSGIPEMHDSLFVVHRGNKQYYVDRCEKQFKLAHFIYIKQKETKKKVTQKKKKKQNDQVIVPAQIKRDKLKKSKNPLNNKQKPKKQEKKTKVKKLTHNIGRHRLPTHPKKPQQKLRKTRKIKKQAY